MGVADSSSYSSSSSKKYQVFLGFRGEDTRRSVTSHLHTALCLNGIETFIDYELPKGDDISQSLVQAIKDSSLSVIVFSENYASFKWCLNELIEILRCKEEQGQLVVPIFYHVDPSHVCHQRGTYEKAFEEHLKKNPDKVDEWRQALLETGKLTGWHPCNYRDEAELIQNIVSDIVKKLNHGSSSALANIVGIDKNCDDIEFLLEGFSIIGIWGMGGIGKTTMAKVVFAKFCSQFDSCCFLGNFREESEKYGQKYIRDKLFIELSNDRSLKGLSPKRVLIVLDDVSDITHLDYLKNEAPPLRHGSKIIITSRDRQVLKGRVERIHKAVALDHDSSLELLNRKAFRKDGYKSEYKELVERALAYAKGVPLALTVLDSFLHSKTTEQWESALSKLERRAHPNIQAVLKLSYDGLDDEEKEVFLDIAFFFKGESEGYVMAMLEGCGFHTHINLRTLMDKAMISVDHGRVWMHDLIQSMAFEIVRQECPRNPERRSRLWNPDEIYDVLKNNQGTNAIQGISLDLSQIRDLQLRADTFKKMTNLRFLKFYWAQRSCIVNLRTWLDSSLRYLQWDNFPSKSLPLSFCAEKLVELHMPYSHLKKLWDGVQNLVNLREIILDGSKYLMELPDISMAQNLEGLYLRSCESLSHINPSILSLPRLDVVSVRDCRSLKSLKSEGQSKSISWIDFYSCSRLKEFSFSSNKIYELRLRDIPVEILDFPIGNMEELAVFSLDCSKLKNLPIDDMILYMRSLVELHLYDCGGMIDESKLHTLFESLLSLERISLTGACKLTELPHNIKHLSGLTSLGLSNCRSLQSLPELPPSIEELDAYGCTSLKTLQLTSHIESSTLEDEKILGSTLYSSVGYLRNLWDLTLSGCEQLYELPESIRSLFSLYSLDLEGSNIESLPASMKHLLNLNCINLNKCRRLRSLPELPFFINSIFADGCISLEIVSTLATTPHLRFLSLKDCLKLENRCMESACFPLKRAIYASEACEFCYPGKKVPEWFKSEQGIDASNNISIELPSNTTDLIGFILCSILSHPAHGNLQCQLYCDGKKHIYSKYGVIRNFDSHHVFLWCVSNAFVNFHKTMDDQNTNYRPKVSFEFSVVTDSEKFVDGVIEACGVCPIYVSEYRKFIRQMELESNLGAQKETCPDVDENSFHGILKYANFSLKTGKFGNLEGSNIPEWFTYKSSMIDQFSGLEARVQLGPDFDKLMGFIFYFVIPNFSLKERDRFHSSCQYYDATEDCNIDDEDGEFNGPFGWHYSMIKLDSDNIFLWYDPFYNECILKRLRRRKGRDAKLDLIFSFNLGCDLTKAGGFFRTGDCLIKEYGVRPIYVSEYTNFLQQEKPQVSMRTKRHRNIDDDQQQLLSKERETPMASASSSSGSGPNALGKYDVFISFRGEDTRNNFISHLHAALNRASLKVFCDDKKLKKDHEIAPSLTQAIKDSSLYVIVFSEDYVSSKWCLDELDQIMQYRKDEGQFVIPIFYKVEPSDVRNQTGAYKKAFENHKIDYQHDPDRVNRWRAALSEAGKLRGALCQSSTDEWTLIQEIVTDVSTKLERIYNCGGTLKDVIGIDEMIGPIEELLEKSHKVGIWGMGGVGKTTMAKAVFAKLSYRYDNCCFVENVREKTEKYGSEHVRNSLISKLLEPDMQNNPSNASRNNAYIARRLGTKKALVVLDDVDSFKLFEYLQENVCNFLAEGSKVIITTRDMQLLRANDYEIHEAKGLSYENSRRLFISKAFRSDHPEDGFKILIEGFVRYAQCNPLALKVLGSLVRSADKKGWDDLLRKLRAGNPNDEIQKVLKLSYNGLNHQEQQIFLDIACFLKGESEEFVEKLLESYGFTGMQTLKDKALIDTTSGKVDMHDLLQEMGCQIVREENIEEPGNRSRLWDTSEIFDVFENCEGGEKVEGIILLDRYATGVSYLTAKTFNKMTGLRFLKIHSPWDYDMSTTANGLESISSPIRYFHWECYPMKSLPSNFCAEHLLELNLNRSWVETLWEGVQDLANLRRLKLQWCRKLRELPDFSKACRLESVDLRGCWSLCYVHASLLSLQSLISLDVGYCWSLESLQSRIHLKSLKEINIDGSYNLKEFSVSSKELTSLDLSETKIEELSPSIVRCSKLTTLYLPDKKLKNLPIKVLSYLTFLKELRISLLKIDNVDLRELFDRLLSLQSLSLQKCRNLSELPDNITQLSSLEKLHLAKFRDLTKLPVNMMHLSKLRYLSVEGCTALRSLPELPPSLRKLDARNCTSLETVPPSTISSTTQNKGEKVFSFKNCVKLDLGAIEEQVKLLLEIAVHEKEDVEVYYPGKKVPEWFGNNRSQNDSDTLKLCLSSHTLVGFVFCAVASDFLEEELCGYLHIAFSVDEDKMTQVEVPGLTYFTSGNVLLRSYPKASESILEKIEGKRRNHDATTYKPNLFFKFSFTSGFFSKPIEECGVYPIYTSENLEWNFNSRKRKAIMMI